MNDTALEAISSEPSVAGGRGRFTYGRDVLALGTLLLCGWKYLHHLERYLDLTLQDEECYLWVGTCMTDPLHWLTTCNAPDRSPFYSVWYHLLSTVIHDSIPLFYVNCVGITLALPVLLYAALRVRKVQIPLAFGVSLFFLVSYCNLGVWPKVNHFCAVILLGAVVFSAFAKRLLQSLWIGGAGCFLCSYVHPEFFYTFILLVITGGLVAILYWRECTWVDLIELLVGAFLAGICLYLIGIPLSGDRGMIAFGQHFSINWLRWNGRTDLRPWFDWEQILRENFGTTAGLGAVLVANPLLFLRHTGVNLLGIPATLAHLFLAHASILVPIRFVYWEGVLLILLMAFLIYRAGVTFSRMRTNLTHNLDLILVAAAYLLPSLIAAIIIFPREHYLFIPGLWLILLPVVILSAREDSPVSQMEMTSTQPSVLRGTDPVRYPVLLLCCVLALVFTPGCQSLLGSNSVLPNITTIRLIRSLEINQEVNLLSQIRFPLHLGMNYTYVHISEKEGDFLDFLRKKAVNMVVVMDRLRNHPAFKEDPEWQAFSKDPNSYGFVRYEVQGTGREVLVRKDLVGQ